MEFTSKEVHVKTKLLTGKNKTKPLQKNIIFEYAK